MTVSVLALTVFGATLLASVGAGHGSASAAPGEPAGHAAVVATGEQCDDITYRWGGDVSVGGATASYDTGVDVAAPAGVTNTVVGVSADGLDASGRAQVLAVHVGGMRASNGAAISGGRVVVSTSSAEALRVVGVTVVVRSCAQVASAAPNALSVPSAPAATSASAAESAAPALPETGADEWRQTIAGAIAVSIGAAMVSFGRRRPSTG
jgi:hypothetical protein